MIPFLQIHRILNKHDSDQTFCIRYNSNARTALDMRQRLGDQRVFVLRYEDLALQPRTMGRKIFEDFLGLPFTERTRGFIERFTGILYIVLKLS